MANRNFTSGGLTGLKNYLATNEWVSLNDTELYQLMVDMLSFEEILNSSTVVRKIVEHVLQTRTNPILTAPAFDLAYALKDRQLVIGFLCAAAFPELVKRRKEDVRSWFNDETGRMLLNVAKRSSHEAQLQILANLQMLVLTQDENGLPATATTVASLSKKLHQGDDALMKLLRACGFDHSDALMLQAASANVSCFSRLNCELRRTGERLRQADADSDGYKFLYQRRDHRSLVAQCVDVVLLEHGGTGSALAYHLRKATGIMINVLFAGEDDLDTGNRMLLLDPISMASDEMAPHLAALIADDILVEPPVVNEFRLGFNAYEVALTSFFSPQQASQFAQRKLSQNAATGLSSLPDANGETTMQIAIYLFLLVKSNNAQAGAFVAAKLTSTLPTEDLLFFLSELHSRLLQSRTLENLVFLSDGSEGGSGLLISHLYRMVNDLPQSQFVTLTRGLKKDRFRTKSLCNNLKGKEVVIIDDCSMTGNQMAELVSFARNNYSVSKITVITAVAADAAVVRMQTAGVEEFLVGMEVPDIRSLAGNLRAALPRHSSLVDLAVEENRYDGQIVTGLVLPHMVPNNTGKWLYELLTRWIDLPAAHSEKCVVKKNAA